MSTPGATVCFLEQTDFSVVLARAVPGPRTLRIEAVGECLLADTAGLHDAIQKILSGDHPLTCALRPKLRRLHLARGEDSSRSPGLGGARHFAATHAEFASLPPAWLSVVQARDGAAPASAAWLLGLTSAAGYSQALAVLDTLRLKPARCVSATHHASGALATHGAGTTLLLEIGELASQAILVGPDGVTGTAAVSLNLERLADAVQAELGLKFRGSAVKIFFNPEYDFSEAGAKIAARIATALKPELANLKGANPTMLACSGLPAAQQWFGTQLASALGLAPFAPDLKVSCAKNGVTFANPQLEAAFSPAWFGFARLLATQAAGPSDSWQAEWLSIDATSAAAPAATPKPATVPIAKPVATPPAPTVTVTDSASAARSKPTGPSPAAAPAPTAAPAKNAVPAKSAPVVVTAAKRTESVPANSAAKAVVESAVSYPPKPIAAARPGQGVAKKNVEVFVPKKFEPPTLIGAAAARAAGAPPPPAKKSSFRKPSVLAAIAAAVLVSLAGTFFAYTQKEEAKRVAAEKLRTEQRLQAEAERARLAEQQARAEAEARKKVEAEIQQKLAASEAARLQAEAEARTQFAARIANARGNLAIATEPAGASITVGPLPARAAPTTFNDLKIGRYPVTISLPLHDTVKLEVEIKENATTDAGVIRLARLVGSVVVTTEPAGCPFEIRPANSLFSAADARRSGQTPATLNDLPPGDYSVTFSRPGWASHTETISVARGATAKATWSFPNGIARIVSTPVGAVVSAGGAQLGQTPLTLNDLPPGELRYELSLPGFDPVPLAGRLEGGDVVELIAEFPPENRFYTPGEVDQKAEPIRPQKPELPYYLTLEQHRVELQVTVAPNGTVKDVQVLSTSDKVFAKLYAEAVAKWRFKPAVVNGKPVAARIIMPFTIAPAPAGVARKS